MEPEWAAYSFDYPLVIDNNYRLLITFQRVDVYLNEPIEIYELIE